MLIEPRRFKFEPTPRRGAGFTLIEIMVVMFLIVLTVGVIAINFKHDDSDLVENEARRFAALVDQLCRESVVQGRVLAITANGFNDYAFLTLGEAGWQPLTGDDLFHDRKLPHNITVRLSIMEPGRSERENLRCEPDGFMTPFAAVFERGATGFKVSTNEQQELEVVPLQ